MRRALAATLTAALAVAVAGCSTNEPTSSSSKSDQLTYVTELLALGRTAYVYVGKTKGFYRDAGIDVKIELGTGTEGNIVALESNKAQVGALDYTGAIIATGQRRDADDTQHLGLRAIMAIHQATLVSVMVPTKGRIQRLSDLPGKTLGVPTGTVNQLIFPAYGKLARFDATKVRLLNMKATELGPALGAGRVDGLCTFLLSQANIAKTAGKDMTVYPVARYMGDLYGNAIFANAQTLKNPDLVKRFRDATLKAIAYTMTHIDEAAAILHAAQPTTPEAAAKSELTAMATYVKPLGVLSASRTAKVIASVRSNGLVKTELVPADVMAEDMAPTQEYAVG